MIIKIIGIAIVFLSCAMAGIAKAMKLSYRVKFLENYLEFVIYVKTQIKYSHMDIVSIIKNYNNDNEDIHNMISTCLNEINRGKSFDNAWKIASEKCLNDLLCYDDISIISSFSNALGKSDIEGQQNHCLLNEENIRNRIKMARNDNEKKNKLYIGMGILVGACISVIFI